MAIYFFRVPVDRRTGGRATVRGVRQGLHRSVAAVLLWLVSVVPAHAVGIYGTMSNFDVFNDSSTDAYGAELELEGVHSSEVTNTYPSHFNQKSVEDYNDGVHFGTRIKFSGYNFDPSGYLAPSVGQSTNGHFCVNLKGCEHFGFAVNNQPTATRYFWLDQGLQRIGASPLAIPSPTWSYVAPANGGQQAVVQAQVEVPEDAENHVQRPDSVWMKVYETELPRAVALDELMSNNDDVVPEDAAETETEWELLEGGKQGLAEGKIKDRDKAVVRRYEFFQYTGAYDGEHEPLSAFLEGDMDAPPANELGPFIAANMVAVNLVRVGALGDLDNSGKLDVGDINALDAALRSGNDNPLYDVNGDETISDQDRDAWVTQLQKTWYGDSNLDGQFESGDLITVFQAGEYEDGIAGNSTWATGDWNGDGEFDTTDLVTAFQDGGYDRGARASVAAVPEPATWTLACLAFLGCRKITVRRSTRRR